jgi:hypothetical protein
MRFGTHFHLGDIVTVELVTGLTRTISLGAAKFTSSTSGLTRQLTPGNPTAGDPLLAQATLLRDLRRRVNRLEREET